MLISKKLLTLTYTLVVLTLISCVPEQGPDTPAPGTGDYEDFHSSPIAPIKINWGVDIPYSPRGVGGGGAMSGLSFSPYSSLWFVGTDMGTLFKSADQGMSWRAVHHSETVFSSNLEYSVSVGFTADPYILFHAPAGTAPVRSSDAGETWTPIDLGLKSGERVEYWSSDSYHAEQVFCATNKGLLMSRNKGLTWQRLGIDGASKGTFLDYKKSGTIIYHATSNAIYQSTDGAASFKIFYQKPQLEISSFTAGRDAKGLTLALVDKDGKSACQDIEAYESDWGAQSIAAHQASCGYLWTADEAGDFTRRDQVAGEHLAMAENNSQVIYVTGSRQWIRQYGTKVWRSLDAGQSFQLMLHQMDWDVVPFKAWDKNKLEYSAPALEQGWWDNGYESFAINRRDASVVGGTGYFFLHTSVNKGETWQAPFTRFFDSGEPQKGKRWTSTGLEVTTVYKFKFHPRNSQLAYAAMADIGGMISEDAGKSFRISQAGHNSNYDYAFNPANDQVVYAASGSSHDFPIGWRANVIEGEGGIFKSNNRGRIWTRLTPSSGAFQRQFLSVGYDADRDVIYGGTQGAGIARSTDGGATWSYFNSGLPSSAKIIPQIEVDLRNGNVYALLSGDAPSFSNHRETGIYFLDVEGGASEWRLLRQTVTRPQGVDQNYELWYFPTAFAIDYRDNGETLWLADYENNQNWLATGVWKSEDNGATWERKQQFTHPLSITLDEANPSKVYVTGQWQIDGNWGAGGAYFSLDGGSTWSKNEQLPFLQNAQGMVIDPNDRSKVFYHFFGSALLYGPRPELLEQ